MTKLLLWAILIAIVVRSLSRLVRGVLEGAGYRRVPPSKPGVALVRDPVCGVFVVPGQALTIGTGDAARFFCSEKCRREWSGRSRARS
jgi:hypothetical protein